MSFLRTYQNDILFLGTLETDESLNLNIGDGTLIAGYG